MDEKIDKIKYIEQYIGSVFEPLMIAMFSIGILQVIPINWHIFFLAIFLIYFLFWFKRYFFLKTNSTGKIGFLVVSSLQANVSHSKQQKDLLEEYLKFSMSEDFFVYFAPKRYSNLLKKKTKSLEKYLDMRHFTFVLQVNEITNGKGVLMYNFIPHIFHVNEKINKGYVESFTKDINFLLGKKISIPSDRNFDNALEQANKFNLYLMYITAILYMLHFNFDKSLTYLGKIDTDIINGKKYTFSKRLNRIKEKLPETAYDLSRFNVSNMYYSPDMGSKEKLRSDCSEMITKISNFIFPKLNRIKDFSLRRQIEYDLFCDLSLRDYLNGNLTGALNNLNKAGKLNLGLHRHYFNYAYIYLLQNKIRRSIKLYLKYYNTNQVHIQGVINFLCKELDRTGDERLLIPIGILNFYCSDKIVGKESLEKVLVIYKGDEPIYNQLNKILKED